MSKVQTDIRTTSYDALSANPYGYQGSIASALKQIRADEEYAPGIKARDELLQYLGVSKIHSNGPSVELDKHVWYGSPK